MVTVLLLDLLECLEYVPGDVHNLRDLKAGSLHQILKVVLFVLMDDLADL